MAEYRQVHLRCGALLLVASASACARTETSEPPLWERRQTDQQLERGRVVWAANCKRCHAYGIEGAPRLGSAAEWGERARRGVPALTRSVIEGRLAKAGGEMPPRAGNPDLRDDQLEAAVRFTLAVSR
jgi:cytochrome c5